MHNSNSEETKLKVLTMQLFSRGIKHCIEVVIKFCGRFHFCVGAKSENRSFCPKTAFFDHPDIFARNF